MNLSYIISTNACQHKSATPHPPSPPPPPLTWLLVHGGCLVDVLQLLDIGDRLVRGPGGSALRHGGRGCGPHG